ncbi:dihydroxy-acid dehydratase family protein [Elioraea sp. Yellowstone]|jgi:dihydroxy-acid dehydratase|uniref:IlvD/Edd family dehydratase n=1 Tax=Elioraea sp. Yellowstone TaxID=2592070 RepID=UPI001153C498|nr:IlvD/Edd family dehydratase [Elioraea sp. Yellowstone]TQF77360.1 dihydroxy-acid dehydratase family protein [Elioraea sp. Yellowstone]
MAEGDGQGSGRKRLRSRQWFDDPDDPGMTALYLERYLNYGLTREELQSGRPIIGIAQTGSDLAPCNRHHLQLASRVKDGIRDAGGVPIEFPIHPIQETGKRPTAALDRNLAYLSLVEVLHGYPIDGVVLTTGCDKTTPACLMGAATVNIPAIVLSGGPMLDGWWNGRLAGSGTVIWEARKLLATGQIDTEQFMQIAASSAPSAGHCNTMGTALSMNSLAEALGMSLPGCAAIPAPYRERGWMAYETGRRIVAMVRENLRPSDILTRAAFENAIVVASAIGASSNCPPHIIAIARHMGVALAIEDWQTIGADIPLLVDCQPAGRFLGERFHRAGGVPAVMKELLDAGRLHGAAMTVTGRTVADNLAAVPEPDREVIRAYARPLKEKAGFVVLSGNLFDNAVMKVSVIDPEFRRRFLADPPDVFEGRAVVFEGPEDYHARIEDPALGVDERTILVIRNCGPVGYPGSAEVVNMQPPKALLARGIAALPTMGDGRQSGTSGSPSILNVSPEAAVGGGLALLRTGDRVRIDLDARRVDVLIDEAELAARRAAWTPPALAHKTPWEEIYRAMVGQLGTGACLEPATLYLNIVETRGESRHSH